MKSKMILFKCKFWFKDGQLEECMYKDGKIEGKYKKWHENGQVYTKATK